MKAFKYYFNLEYLILLIIFTIALFLRLYQLSSFPVGFHGDEASIGYNAFSLLKTGRDQNGTFLPLAVDQWGDFRPAGYHYLAIPSVAIFGLTEFATRFPGALVGALTIFPLFFLTKYLFSKKTIALVGAGLLAVSPWHFNLSRATSESIPALFFVILGTTLLLKAINNKKLSYLNLAMIFITYSLSFLFYHAARFFVPPFLVLSSVLIIIQPGAKPKTTNKIFILNMALIFALGLIFIFSRGSNRATDISIFNSPFSQLVLDEKIREDGNQPSIITRLWHNKASEYFSTASENYFQHFTGDFLYTKGGLPVRYQVPWTGNFYLIEAPFFIIGLSFLVYKLINKQSLLFGLPIIWLVLGPLPAAPTFEDIPNIVRSIMLLPSIIIITSFGFIETLNLIKNNLIQKIVIFFCLIILAYSLTLFLHNYFHHSLTHQPWYRNVGEKELTETAKQLSENGTKIYMSTALDNNISFYLFFWKIDPRFYQNLGSPRDHSGMEFENLIFIHNDCPLEANRNGLAEGNPDIYYVNRGECQMPLNTEEIKSIKRTDNSVAFRIIKINPDYKLPRTR